MSTRLIKAVIKRRAVIQREIDEEEASGNPHWLRLARLKKIRLRLKDQLARLTRFNPDPDRPDAADLRRRLRARSR